MEGRRSLQEGVRDQDRADGCPRGFFSWPRAQAATKAKAMLRELHSMMGQGITCSPASNLEGGQALAGGCGTECGTATRSPLARHHPCVAVFGVFACCDSGGLEPQQAGLVGPGRADAEEDVQQFMGLVVQQTGASRSQALSALQRTGGDVVAAVMLIDAERRCA